jgi:hypothetical protein
LTCLIFLGDHQGNPVSWIYTQAAKMTDHVARDSRARSSSPSLIVCSPLVTGNHSESNDHDTFPAIYSILFKHSTFPYTCSQHSQQWPGLSFTYSSLPPRPPPARTKPQAIHASLSLLNKSISKDILSQFFYVWPNL